MIYIAATHLADPSICKILKLIKSNAQHSLWRICDVVWLLPAMVHVASVSEFKSSRAKLLTLPWVTTCFNLWKFVRVSYSNRLLLWKTYFQKVTSQPLFTDSKSNKQSLVLMKSACVRFLAKILLHCLKKIFTASSLQ